MEIYPEGHKFFASINFHDIIDKQPAILHILVFMTQTARPCPANTPGAFLFY